MTLAVPGAAGFVALVQRAVIKQSRTLTPESGTRCHSELCFSSCLIRRRPRGFGDTRGRACWARGGRGRPCLNVVAELESV